MTQGRFITLEGGEGAGKTTQSALLAEALMAKGVPVLRTREPGGAPGAELLREILLGGSIDWSPQAETLLHFAARTEHVAKTHPAGDRMPAHGWFATGSSIRPWLIRDTGRGLTGISLPSRSGCLASVRR